MGMGASLYGVDLERLRAAVGSGDRALLGRIRRAEKDEFLDDDAFIEKGDLSLGQALEELLDGRLSRPDCGFQYGYAVELLCRGLGTCLASLLWWEFFESTPMRMTRSPVPIPEPDDYPFIHYMTADEVRVEAGRQTPASLGAPDGSEEQEERRRFVECLHWCEKRGLGLVMIQS